MLGVVSAVVDLIHSHVVGDALWLSILHYQLLISLEKTRVIFFLELLVLRYLSLKIVPFDLVRHKLVLSLGYHISMVFLDLTFSDLWLGCKVAFLKLRGIQIAFSLFNCDILDLCRGLDVTL